MLTLTWVQRILVGLSIGAGAAGLWTWMPRAAEWPPWPWWLTLGLLLAFGGMQGLSHTQVISEAVRRRWMFFLLDLSEGLPLLIVLFVAAKAGWRSADLVLRALIILWWACRGLLGWPWPWPRWPGLYRHLLRPGDVVWFRQGWRGMNLGVVCAVPPRGGCLIRQWDETQPRLISYTAL